MALKNAVPLGFIELPNDTKAIFPMNDIFLTHMFMQETYWETLRTIVIALSKTTKKRYNERKKGEEKWQERIQRT